MIENPYPAMWQDLQKGVYRILNEIGLRAELGKVIATPRGNVEIDVYAVDENSVDKIKYIIECKNWNVNIPQTVVHAFTTVMNEVGGNIGYIISKKGFQIGAIEYTKNTNIKCLSYEDFQRKYFPIWFEKYFVSKIGDSVDALVQYVEPINSRRERIIDQLPKKKREEFFTLLDRYRNFGISMAFFEFPRYSSYFSISPPADINELKQKLSELGEEFVFNAIYFRDLLKELIQKIEEVTGKFHAIFGKNIFA